jgi:hypothetical protein
MCAKTARMEDCDGIRSCATLVTMLRQEGGEFGTACGN